MTGSWFRQGSLLTVVLVLIWTGSAQGQTRTLMGVSPGTLVKVEGRASNGGVMTVERVRARDTDGNIRLEGQIASIEDGGRQLRLLEFTVAVPQTARVLDGDARLPGPEALRVGDRVEVRGLPDGRARVTANRVRRAPRIGSPRDEIEAPLERVLDSRTFELLGRRMQLARGAKFLDERVGAPRQTVLRRDDDEQQIEAIRLGNWGVLGGRVDTTFEERDNLDLDSSPSREADVQSTLRLDLSAQLGRRALAYAKVYSTGTYGVTPSASLPIDLQVKEANLLFSVAGPLTLQVGRVRVRDSFEWYADDYLDAARLAFTTERTRAEAGVSYGVGTPAAGRSRSDERQAFASASHEFARALTVGVLMLARDDRTRNEQPRWLFGQAYGRAGALRYWGNGALRRGRSTTATFAGWAFDTGAALRLGSGGPTLTLGYAVGSGDVDRSDSVDRTFRQTGLEDTETRLAGYKRIHTYGQLLEPDLSNLRVTTLGLGRQWATVSLDVVHHAYWQDVPRRTPSSSSLGLRPNGGAGVLGQEIDGLMTLRLGNGLDVSLVSGVFLPGPAQAAPAKPAFFIRPQVQFFF